MDEVLIRKPENPARAFLRRYRAMCVRQETWRAWTAKPTKEQREEEPWSC